MDTQPEALRLADELEGEDSDFSCLEAADELRRLHEVNQELLEALMECPVWGNKAQIAIAKATGG